MPEAHSGRQVPFNFSTQLVAESEARIRASWELLARTEHLTRRFQSPKPILEHGREPHDEMFGPWLETPEDPQQRPFRGDSL